MAEDKNGFLLYKDLIKTVEKLPIDKAGELFMHILKYVNDEDPETNDLLIEVAFEPVKQKLKRDLRKYEETKEKNRDNARKRWNKNQSQPLPTDATACDRIPTNAKHADSDTGNDSDSDTGNDSDSDTGNDSDTDILLEKETKRGELFNIDAEHAKPPNPVTSKKVAQKKVSFKPPYPSEVESYCIERQNGIKGQEFWDFYQSKGWMVGKNKMKDWRASVRTWEQSRKNKANGSANNTRINGRSAINPDTLTPEFT